MSRTPAPDFPYCESRGARPGTLQFLVYRFSPEPLRNLVLAQQTLVHEIRSILFEVTDPGVAVAKLGWWQQELTPDKRIRSQHPAVRFASQCGLFDRVKSQDFWLLLTATATMARGEAIPDRESLLAACSGMGQPELAMLLAIEETGSESEYVEPVGTAMGLVRLLEQVHRTLPGDCWWVPLQDQARFGISFSEARDPDHRKDRSALLESLADEARESLGSAIAAGWAPSNVGGRIFPILFKVLTKRIERVRSGSAAFLRRNSIGELWAAWTAAVLPR